MKNTNYFFASFLGFIPGFFIWNTIDHRRVGKRAIRKHACGGGTFFIADTLECLSLFLRAARGGRAY